MKSRTRYGILIFGFLLFLILAPLVALYTSGFRIDFSDGSIAQTGILSATTSPDNATISVDGQPRDTTPASIRFLKPGDYTVGISKEGYFSWQKRLSIKDGVVTWVNQDSEDLYLLLQDGQETTVANNANDMAVVDDRLLVLSDKTLSLSNAPKFDSWDTITLPVPISSIITTSRTDVVLLVGGKSVLMLSLGNQQITDITNLIVPGSRLTVLSPTHFVVQEAAQAFLVNASTGVKTLLEKDVLTITNFNNDVYFLKTEGAAMTLTLRTISGDSVGESRILARDLPKVNASQLIVTPQKHIYILANQTLYVINDKLDSLYSGIVSLQYDPLHGNISFQTGNELFEVRDEIERPQLITRYGGSISNPVFLDLIGYAIFVQDDQVVALELDSRDSQNRYSLMQIKKPRKLYVISDGQQLIALDDLAVKVRKLRD